MYGATIFEGKLAGEKVRVMVGLCETYLVYAERGAYLGSIDPEAPDAFRVHVSGLGTMPETRTSVMRAAEFLVRTRRQDFNARLAAEEAQLRPEPLRVGVAPTEDQIRRMVAEELAAERKSIY